MDEKEKARHRGHRHRSRERFLEHGLEGFKDLDALEFLLQYAVPRRDTTPAAQALLARFGTLSDVLNASYEELRDTKDVGEGAAVLLKLIPAVSKRYMLALTPEKIQLKDVKEMGRFLLPYFMYEREELLLAVYLDNRDRVMRVDEISRGTVDGTAVLTRKIATTALMLHAAGVIVSHNHPSGEVDPSAEDLASTRMLGFALALVDVRLRDHIVVAGSRYLSLCEYGQFLEAGGDDEMPVKQLHDGEWYERLQVQNREKKDLQKE
ncbi:MAG: DNA repair protein RadC [Eubacteriales bacterium]|nr:DNA repair protein RadC [Eubacteriales bacterium]